MGSEKFIIDADTGSDDAVALLIALRSPTIEVLGITIASGNVPMKQGIINTLSTTELCEQSIKIYAGAEKPLERDYIELDSLKKFIEHVRSRNSAAASGQCVHGTDGMGDIGVVPKNIDIEPLPVDDFLVYSFNENPEEITLVTLGPLTNVAKAIQKDNSIAQKIKHCYIMGGTSDGSGNVSAAAEYNIWVDPEAAKIVFDSGMQITMVGWDNSYKYAMLREDEINKIKSVNTEYADFAVDIQKTLRELTFDAYGFDGFDLPDPITMAIAIDNSIIEESQQLHVVIDTRDGLTRGQTIVDYFDAEGGDNNVRVVTKSSKEKFMELLMASVT